MEGDFIKINKSLLPLSCLYGMGVGIRNFCFDVGILKSRSFDVPVISVGNITVGGTGKTPHVEYLIRLLQNYVGDKRLPGDFQVAVLSRGYKRKTSGFLLSDEQTTAREIGDEPYQMKQKFPKVYVAVDKKRVRGIQRLTEEKKDIDVILLDDAFQHRYVTPGINILLVDYHRLVIYDRLLPAGRLREPLSGKNRADIVIITKCPKELKPMDYRVITKAMDLFPYQQLFFTTLVYDCPQPLFSQTPIDSLEALKDRHVMLLTGIASPRQMEEDLAPYAADLTPLSFPDHHDFTPKDIEQINQTFDALPSPKCIITTEKDAARIKNTTGLSDDVRQNIYALPIRVSFINKEKEELFNHYIIDYVRKNSRNSILVKSKDDNKSQDGNSLRNGSRTISFRNN